MNNKKCHCNLLTRPNAFSENILYDHDRNKFFLNAFGIFKQMKAKVRELSKNIYHLCFWIYWCMFLSQPID